MIALYLAVAPSLLFADPRLPAVLGPIDPRPGAWAEYLVRTSGRGDVRVRVTALAAEGEGRYWLELLAAGGNGVASAARLLVHGEPSPSGIERMHLMLAGQQPVEIPLDRVRLAMPRKEIRATARGGRESVSVRAGTFTAQMLRAGRTRIWRAPGVPLWGLVKARSRLQSIELLACGVSGGHSVFPPGWDQGNGRESAK